MGCISKGKAKQACDFGVKVGNASTLKGNLIVAARAFHDNPPRTAIPRGGQLEQATIQMRERAFEPATAFVDLGDWGWWTHRNRMCASCTGQGQADRRAGQKATQAIKPIIGHFKANHRMDRCHLKDKRVDRLHTVRGEPHYQLAVANACLDSVTFLRVIFSCLPQAVVPARSRLAQVGSAMHAAPTAGR